MNHLQRCFWILTWLGYEALDHLYHFPMRFELAHHSCDQEIQHLRLFFWMTDCYINLIKKLHLFLKWL